MLNNSTPLPIPSYLIKFQTDRDNITFNKTPSKNELKITHTSSNKPNNIEDDDDIIPRILDSSHKKSKKINSYQDYSIPNENIEITKKEKENLSNYYNSINANNSLFNEQENESPIIREKYNLSSSNKINPGKMSISELYDEKPNDEDGEDEIEDDNNISENNDDNYNDDYEEEKKKKKIFNKENEEKILEDFINENNNKNIISQKENEYALFDINNTINNDINNKLNININEILNSDNNNDNENENSDKKRNFFSKIIDIEILIDTNEIYSKPWSQIMNDIYKQCELNNDSIQLISLGSQHTLCISNKGKLYTFGWNNYSQCGKKAKKMKNKNINIDTVEKIEEINEIKIGKNINDISTGEDHSLIIVDEGKIYGFGLNNIGQLCYNPNKHKIIKKPSLIKSFKKFNITNVQCTDNISFIVNNIGEAFICPWEDQQNQIHYTPFKLYFPYKPKISSISCGDNFSIFLSERGNVYSMGSNNKYGQLGLGDTNIQLSPKIISFFKTNKIKICQISCGYCHVMALSDKGNVYSWGYGGEGQLGHGEEILENYIPKLIEYFTDNDIVIFQISSGFHNSYFLTEKNTVYVCGTCGRDCNKEFNPVLIDIKVKYKDLVKSPCWICRILNCWNRSMSVFYAIFLDCHFINKDDEEVNKVLSLMSKKWVHQSFSCSIMQGINSMNYN